MVRKDKLKPIVSAVVRSVEDAIDAMRRGFRNIKSTEAGPGLASGGLIAGRSPHTRADNILVRLTAGEFVEPVEVVRHYGADLFEAFRRKMIPKEITTDWFNRISGYNSGGLAGLKESLPIGLNRANNVLKGLTQGFAGGGKIDRLDMPAWLEQFLALVEYGWQSNALAWQADIYGGYRPMVGYKAPSTGLLEIEQMAAQYKDPWESPLGIKAKEWFTNHYGALELLLPGGFSGTVFTDDEFIEKLERILEQAQKRRPQ